MESEIDVATTLAAHRTSVLDAQSAGNMPGVIAMQQYYAFAQDRLAAASGGAPAASQALYALGKIYMALADESMSAKRLQGAKAIAFHQASMMVDPTNHAAANELGVLLARFGQLKEARSVLQHSVSVRPLTETWHNLSVVHQRLGEVDLSNQSRLEWQRAEQQAQTSPGLGGSSVNSTVTWVDPQTFAQGNLQPVLPQVAPAIAPPRQAHRNQFRWPWSS